MICLLARRQLSGFLDGDLPSNTARRLTAHLESCPDCSARLRSLRVALESLNELPRLSTGESVASRVFDRLEVESRGPGLALVFRSMLGARPLILPSLVTASLLLAAVFMSVLALDRPAPLARLLVAEESWPPVRQGSWGTEANPLMPFAGVDVPQARSGFSSADLLGDMGEGTLFLETVVARDGTVSNVTLIAGDVEQARPVLDALRQQRFEPVRYRGRPVAVSVYRLISRMDVRSPVT
jgi:hypothetical protein